MSGLVLGVHYGHDATAALLGDQGIVAVLTEERLSRRKHQWGLPVGAIREVLKIAGASAAEVEILAFSGRTPWVQMPGRIVAGDGSSSAYRPHPLTRLKKRVGDLVKGRSDWADQIAAIGLRPRDTCFVEHHLCHAASAYYTSGHDEALVVTVDGYGDGVSATVSHGRGEDLQRVSASRQAGSLGSFYQAVTEALGFAPIEGENKTMGLAPFGDPDRFYARLREWVSCDAEGRLQAREPWGYRSIRAYDADYTGIRQQSELASWLESEQDRQDLAAAAQRVVEETLVDFVEKARARVGRDLPLCAAGGVMLNVKANRLIQDHMEGHSFFVFPDAGDAGTALGAALYAQRLVSGRAALGKLRSVYYGTEPTEPEIVTALEARGDAVAFRRPPALVETVADLLHQGRVVGWFQGRMEMGPRALGARSVLADPRDPEVKDHINRSLKKRDWFVPFAPSGLEAALGRYLVDYVPEPFMTKAFLVRDEYRLRLPAVTHVDGTARPQGVVRETNPLYADLLAAFERRTGVPILLNTSFNRHGVPIVCRPEDAVDHLLEGNVDVLAIGPFVAQRSSG